MEGRIAYLIIDGYNLIGIHHGDLDLKRKELIRDLIEYRKAKGHDITVVFDGHGGVSLKETINIEEGIRVIYSRMAKKADEVIKEIVREKNRFYIVVSSDREVAGYAWAAGSVPVRSEDFNERMMEVLLGRADDEYKWPDDMYDDRLAEENEYGPQKKGFFHRLSKRERAVMRALNKL